MLRISFVFSWYLATNGLGSGKTWAKTEVIDGLGAVWLVASFKISLEFEVAKMVDSPWFLMLQQGGRRERLCYFFKSSLNKNSSRQCCGYRTDFGVRIRNTDRISCSHNV
jgi:hypothetical protein